MIKAVLVTLLHFLVYSSSFARPETLHYELTIKNHSFEPAQITAPAGYLLKIKVTNLDNTVEEFESIDLKREKIVPAGGSVMIILAPLKPGIYKFFGEFHAKTAQGLLIITENKNV